MRCSIEHKRRAVLVGLAVALAWSPVLADEADGSGGGLVLESYVGERPADANAITAPVYAELQRRGFKSGADATGAIDARMAGPGDDPSDENLAAVASRVERAEASYYKGSFEDAVKDAEASWKTLVGWSGYLARNQDKRMLLRRALAVYAEAQRRRGAPDEATRAMSELVRSFPDKPLTTAEYSPKLVRFYRQVARELDKQGPGTLEVAVDDPSVAVFIDEQYAGAGTVEKQLVPGRYRIYVQKSDERPGRVHEVVLGADARERVAITWALDGALRTREAFAGFAFSDERGRRRDEAKNAVQVARVLLADRVIVLGIRVYDERRALIGAVLSLDTGKQQKSAHLALEPVLPSDDRLREMARFLAGDESAGPFEPVREAPLPDDIAVLPGQPFRLLKWATVATGVGALATGVTLIAIHRENLPDQQVPFTRNSRPAGILTVSAGAVLTGVGVYFFIRDSRDARARKRARGALRDQSVSSLTPTWVPTVASTGGGLAVGLSGRF